MLLKTTATQKAGEHTCKQLKAKMNSASFGPPPQLPKLPATQCSLPSAFNSASLPISPQKPSRQLYLSQMLTKTPKASTKSPELLLPSKLTLLLSLRYNKSTELLLTHSTPSTHSMALLQPPKAETWSMPMKCSSKTPKTPTWS